ncbi:MAG: DUF86 domain-containing protein [Verrucomicrobiae bacterium]|nr:DUF86 domain-containing protein [Verrucomicrobiae bacterium]
MSVKDNRLYLIHIHECLEWIERFAQEGRENFMSDRKTQDAILRNLHTLTESTQHLAESMKNNHPEVNWREISGFRNVVVHDYLGIDLERTWNIIEKDIPQLKITILKMKKEMGI